MSSGKGELALVEFFRRSAGRDPHRVPIGIGDDMACLRVQADSILITTDMLLDGVHFDSKQHTCEQIGRKAIACSLSDCAAMACKPAGAAVSVALSASMGQPDAERLFTGMKAVADEFDCPIVGGDTTSWTHPLAIDVSMLAEPATPRSPVRRAGARAGDDVYVTGLLGGSLAGRHLSFTPRVREATVLARDLRDKLHAMMDLSDGLSLDLLRLCQAGGVGAELDQALLESAISDAARGAARDDGKTPLEHALHDGEDFELLFVVEAGTSVPDLGVPHTRAGRITRDALTIRSGTGAVSPLRPGGYEHFK